MSDNSSKAHRTKNYLSFCTANILIYVAHALFQHEWLVYDDEQSDCIKISLSVGQSLI